MKILPENPEFAEIRHGYLIFTLQLRHGSTDGQCAEAFFFYLSLVLVRVCEIEFSRTPDLDFRCFYP